MTKKTALLLVQGISEKEYIDSEEILKILNPLYDFVVTVPTEKMLDIASPKVKVWDKYGDIIKFFLNPLRREANCLLISDKIACLKQSGISNIDILAHSLGTCFTLCSSGGVSTIYLYASPLGIKNHLFRQIIKWFIKKNEKIFAKKIKVIFSQKDLVCAQIASKKEQESLRSILKTKVPRITTQTDDGISFIETETGHSLIEYLRAVPPEGIGKKNKHS